ncbi:branched-chain amino acid ABC transporter permease [Nocardioides sp. CFH 31398]|uniref:branched-chain amino acid ABC transporter permease n=1 Tax=Nocardioides sp. CFH 31398 TaxID=2919579 RepID=UPI001F06FEA5|nr:branched-chain amino acid ABC transporter permease [Nocardioides sp. CFH 31398]MCH1867813.1 branched-chain amino acid ABC transporter permease [Nocardioides sp. CFH 31398]
MDALIFPLSTLAIIVCLGALLHLQFGQAGIVNFGVVGFSGLGMYLTAILVIEAEQPFGLALVIATVVTGLVAAALGWLILDLDNEAVLVATLAFATIVWHLSTTEDQLTGGVVGLGTVPLPFDLGDYRATTLAYLGVLVAIAAALVLYARQVSRVPYGRLIRSIQDNEPLARSLGKPTFRHKVVFFAVTCALMGTIGGLDAAVQQFLVPRLLLADTTFVVWIALILGGRTRVLGAFFGALLTVGLFDIVVEQYVEVPREYSLLLPDLQLMAFGMVLMLVILFRPAGLLGDGRKRRAPGAAKGASA